MSPRSRQNAGIQRALGLVFFTCIDEFTANETQWFFENEGAANALLSFAKWALGAKCATRVTLLSFASSLNEDVTVLYTDQYVDSQLETEQCSPLPQPRGRYFQPYSLGATSLL